MSYHVIFSPTSIGVDTRYGRGQTDEIRRSYPTLEDAQCRLHLPPPMPGYAAKKILSDANEVVWRSKSEGAISFWLADNVEYNAYVKKFAPWLSLEGQSSMG